MQSEGGLTQPLPPVIDPPPRWRMAKRVTFVALLWVLFLVGVRVWWGWYAERQLNAAIEHYRALGQPVTKEDFLAAMPDLSDEENAAYYLKKAYEAFVPWELVFDTTSLDTGAVPRRPSANDEAALREHERLIARFLEANRGTLENAHAAAMRSDADWDLKLVYPLYVTTAIPNTQPATDVARLLDLAARHAHLQARDEEALSHVHALVSEARIIVDNYPTLIMMLESLTVDWLACEAVECIAPELRIASQGSPSPRLENATRNQVRELVSMLLDDDFVRSRWEYALRSEHMTIIDGVSTIWTGQAWCDWWLTAFVGPAGKLDGIRVLEFYHTLERAGSSDNYADAQKRWPVIVSQPMNYGPAAYLARFVSQMGFSAGGLTRIQYRSLAFRRMAAIALALRIYEIDHGERPSELAALAPDYLDAIPPDPFDPDGGPLRYAPAATPPTLYSVGEDGVDDGGAYGVAVDGGKRSGNDRTFSLERAAAASPDSARSNKPETDEPPSWDDEPSYFDDPAPASTQAVPDDGEEEQPADDQRRPQQDQ